MKYESDHWCPLLNNVPGRVLITSGIRDLHRWLLSDEYQSQGLVSDSSADLILRAPTALPHYYTHNLFYVSNLHVRNGGYR